MLKLIRQEKQVAKDDIKVYILFRDNKYELPWNINEKVEISKLKDYGYFGFYSYKFKEDLERFINLLGKETNLTIKEAIILKGSEYYEGIQNYSFKVSKEYIELYGFISNMIKIIE